MTTAKVGVLVGQHLTLDLMQSLSLISLISLFLDQARHEALPHSAALGRRVVHGRRLRRDLQLLGAHALSALWKGISGS